MRERARQAPAAVLELGDDGGEVGGEAAIAARDAGVDADAVEDREELARDPGMIEAGEEALERAGPMRVTSELAPAGVLGGDQAEEPEVASASAKVSRRTGRGASPRSLLGIRRRAPRRAGGSRRRHAPPTCQGRPVSIWR